ncbi:MAG: hypothetical protein JWR26_4602 [Pedosphaera sp.]|nr:hypothetical protein [Pedosphaera sp.]
MFLGRPTSQKSRVQPGKDFLQGEFDESAIAIVLHAESAGRRSLTQFTEGEFDRTLGNLGEDLLHGDEELGLADFNLADPQGEVRTKTADNAP